MPNPKPQPYSRRSWWRAHLDQITPPEENQPQEINVGRRLQTLRKARGISQRALADLSGLNFNTLSLIENEKSSPNVSTLQQLAEALNVPVTAFFETPMIERKMVVLQKGGERVRTIFDHGTFADLGGGISMGEGTPLLLTLDPHQDSGEDPIVHTGQEFVYILSGEMVYIIDGTEYLLKTGDSLIFEASLAHRWANQADTLAQALVVICPADEDDRSVTQHLPVEETQ